MQDSVPLRVCLFGVPGAQFNHGVGALRQSAAAGLLSRRSDADLTVFDDGWGVRPASIVVEGTSHGYRLCGARNSRRIHRPESYRHMRLAAALRVLRNPGLRLLDRSDVVWDVSGGDSFSDLYGRQRFETVTLPKELAVDRGRPLVLLPQTYGPFADRALRDRARTVLARADSAWARDTDSFEALQALLGPDFDASKHRLGVDLAFGLEAVAPEERVVEGFRQATGRCVGQPLVGFNVSGLLLDDPVARERYGLQADYRVVVERVAQALLSDGAFLVLVPHVQGAPGANGPDSDDSATTRLFHSLGAAHPGRVWVAPVDLDASGRKWLIGHMDWFFGARMHATIAGLSSGVPTTALAYSGKFRGVFDTCGQADHVIDARSVSTAAAVEHILADWSAREPTRQALESQVPAVLAAGRRQMDEIVARSESPPSAPS